jgi:NADPH:quinone reductase-like Zn-dependent oxidoreductase
MQRIWRNGSFAEKALYPASCLTVLPEAREWDRPELLAFLASLAIADGGLRRGELRGGQTVVVNGATGNLGGAAVLAALARGAARVVATGRRTELSARQGWSVAPGTTSRWPTSASSGGS